MNQDQWIDDTDELWFQQFIDQDQVGPRTGNSRLPATLDLPSQESTAGMNKLSS